MSTLLLALQIPKSVIKAPLGIPRVGREFNGYVLPTVCLTAYSP